MPNIDVNSDHVNLKCKVRRSLQAINPDFDECQDMTCTLKNWNGNSPTAITSLAFPPDNFFDQLSKSTHGSKRLNQGGPELVLSPVPLTRRDSESDNSIASGRAIALAKGVHQRFRSFGSIPISNYPPNIEIPVKRRHSRSGSSSGIYDCPKDVNGGTPPITPRLSPKRSKSDSYADRTSPLNNGQTLQRHSKYDKIHIPINDVIVVDTDGSNSPSTSCRCLPTQDMEIHEVYQMCITTFTSGYFEFTFYSKNAQDVMVAFLQSTLPSERFTRVGQRRNNDPQSSNYVVGESSYDMEYFTVKEMNDMLKSESFSEKIKSKVQNFFSSIDTITNHFTECVCGDVSARPLSPQYYKDQETSIREPTPLRPSETTSRSDVPVLLFSYEDNDINMRDSAPTIDAGAYISYSIVSNADSSGSHKSSFSRDVGKWKRKKFSPIPV